VSRDDSATPLPRPRAGLVALVVLAPVALVLTLACGPAPTPARGETPEIADLIAQEKATTDALVAAARAVAAVAVTCPEGTVARSIGGECWCVDRVTLRPVQRCGSSPVPTPTSAPPTPVPTVAPPTPGPTVPAPTPTAPAGPTPTPGVYTWLSGSLAIQDVPGRFTHASDGTLLFDGRPVYVPRLDASGTQQIARYALRRIQ